MDSDHPLRPVLEAAARGSFPEPDGTVTLQRAPGGGGAAVIGLTAAHFILTDLPESEVMSQLDVSDIAAAMRPQFLAWLARRLEMESGFVDLLMARLGLGGGSEHLHLVDDHESRRVARAERFRSALAIHVNADRSAAVVLGTGLVGRLEISIELDTASRFAGQGTRLLLDALRAIEPHQAVFAQVSPGNAASVRAFLGAGFKPIGSEALISPQS